MRDEMESFKKRSSSLYKNPLDQPHEKLLFEGLKETLRKNATPIREPRSNELLTLGHGEYELGAQKAPKIATLLGQTSEDLRKQILNRIRDENI